MQRVTIVDQIELKPGPFVYLRMGLCIADGDVIVGEPRWHRTSFRHDTDVEATMALVNTHLATMGEAPVPADEIQRIKRAVAFHMAEYPVDADPAD